jgi:hypothetical protein
MTPMHICAQILNEEDFYNYITKELVRRNLTHTRYNKLVLEHGKDNSRQ